MSRAVARLCSLPLILFFVGYNVRGENACPSVPLLPHGFDCPFQNEKVKGCLRQFFSMLPFADPQAEAHGSTEKNKPLTFSFFHFQSHPRGSKLHCISGKIHVRIYPLDKWLATCYIIMIQRRKPRPFARTRVGVSPMQRRCFARATHFSNRALES